MALEESKKVSNIAPGETNALNDGGEGVDGSQAFGIAIVNGSQSLNTAPERSREANYGWTGVDESDSDSDADVVTDHFNTILNTAKSVNFANEKQAKDFRLNHEIYINRAGKHKRNIVHEIVDKSHDLHNIEFIKPFLKWLLATYPSLLKETDNREKQTPLHYAFSREKPDLIKVFLESNAAAMAIRIPSKRSSCLHDAIRDYPEYVPSLLEKANGNEYVLRQQDNDGNTALHVAVRPTKRSNYRNMQLKIVKQLTEACPTAMDDRNKKGQSPYQYLYHHRAQENTGPIPYNNGEDEVADFLRLYSMRNRKRSETVDFLYGDGQVHEIEFSLVYPSITEHDLRNLVGVLQFESVLCYVRRPKIFIEKDRAPSPAQRSKVMSGYGQENFSLGQEQGKGERDLGIIFKLLQDKGVGKILKVVFEDRRGNPHSDDVIEESLKPFDIEVWDWKKFDICSEAIHNAAPNLREISLYSSGNNAVLCSWSAPDGLAKFEHLETVRLFIGHGFEPQKRTNCNIKEFRERLTAVRPKVKIYPHEYLRESDRDGDASASQETNKILPKKQQWLTSMEKFARFIRNIKEEPDVEVQAAPVKVALIDDGIETKHFCEHIKTGVSFCSSDDDGITSGFYIPTGEHGTLMATLITDIFPMARLYVARLDEYFTLDGDRQITARSAAQAIRVAEDKKILMFGAANDQAAASSTISYPCSLSGVFCIGAATLTGRPLKSGSDSKVNFIFPGEKVFVESRHRLSGPMTVLPLPLDPRSGSSIATALATGLAAPILYCVEVVSPERWEGLRNHNHMDLAFQALCKRGSENYPKVWHFFVVNFEDLEFRPQWQEKLELLLNDLFGKEWLAEKKRSESQGVKLLRD